MLTDLDRNLLRHVTGPALLGGEVFPTTVRPRPPRHNSGVGRRFAAALGRLWRAISVAQQCRATARALDALGDQALHDIGVGRANIPGIARQAAAAHLAVAGLAWSSTSTQPASNDNPRHRAA